MIPDTFRSLSMVPRSSLFKPGEINTCSSYTGPSSDPGTSSRTVPRRCAALTTAHAKKSTQVYTFMLGQASVTAAWLNSAAKSLENKSYACCRVSILKAWKWATIFAPAYFKAWRTGWALALFRHCGRSQVAAERKEIPSPNNVPVCSHYRLLLCYSVLG